MPRISPFQIAMGVGTSGAMVDVSAYVAFQENVTRSYGTQDDFRDPNPGTFAFTLNNQDGRFTPGSTVYATPVVEGMPVSWLLGTRLVSGSVLSVVLPVDQLRWGFITVTCDDMLGNASRVTLSGANLAEAMIFSSPAYLYWPLSDVLGSTTAAEMSGNGDVPLNVLAAATFGVAGVAAVGSTQVRVGSPAGNTLSSGNTRSIQYRNGSAGVWSFWLTPEADPGAGIGLWQIVLNVQTSSGLAGPTWSITSLAAGMVMNGESGASVTTGPLTVNVPHFFSTVIAYNSVAQTRTYTLYMDGVLVGSATKTGVVTLPSPSAAYALLSTNASAAGSFLLQHLSHTVGLFNETLGGNNVASATESTLFPVLSQIGSNVTIGTLPANLSTAPVGPIATTSVTAFQLLCDLIRTERGYIYTATTGTLLAPVQTIMVRARDRPATPSVVLDSFADISGVPPFLRDITNTVSALTVTGAGSSLLVVDSTAASRVGAANANETINNNVSTDIYTWGTDRIGRGKNPTLRLQMLTVDVLTVSAATATAILGLTLGDRVQLAGLPSASLGFTTWDGWLIGATETHNIAAHSFDLYFATALPATGIYDTSLFASGSMVVQTLNPILSTDTSCTISSVDVIEATTVGYSIQIDNEIMLVTAVTPFGGNYIATVTRAQSGTTAAAHAGGAAVEIVPTALYAF